MLFVRVVVLTTQNFRSPAARGSLQRGSGTNAKLSCHAALGSGENANFQSPVARGSGPRGSGTNAKYSKGMPRVIEVRTQNILSPAASDICSCGSGALGSGTK